MAGGPIDLADPFVAALSNGDPITQVTFTLGMLAVLAAASTSLLLDLWGSRAPWSLGWVGTPIALAYSGIGGIYGLFFIIPAVMDEQGFAAVAEGVRVPLLASYLALSLSTLALVLAAVTSTLVAVLRPGEHPRLDGVGLIGSAAGAIVGGVLAGVLLAFLPGVAELGSRVILLVGLAVLLTLAVVASAIRLDGDSPGRSAAARCTVALAAVTALVLGGQAAQVDGLVATLHSLAMAASASPDLVQSGVASAGLLPLAGACLAVAPLLAGAGALVSSIPRVQTADGVSMAVAVGLVVGCVALGWCATEVAGGSVDVVTRIVTVNDEIPVELPRAP